VFYSLKNKDLKMSEYHGDINENKPCCLQYNLRQHSPMIHFQFEQQGATLRASEFKPKLDRFIALEMENLLPNLFEQYQELITSKFKLIENGTRRGCNEYKITIQTNKNFPATKDIPDSKLFFANNAEKDKRKKVKQISFSRPLAVQVKAFSNELLGLIDSVLPYFLAIHNFGARSSKGFGCYQLNKSNRMKMNKTVYGKIFQEINLPIYELTTAGLSNDDDAFKTISEFYTKLKPGLNYNKYEKSYLYCYMEQKGIIWEKRQIKEQFPEVVHGRKSTPSALKDDSTLKYIRAVLGLAEINEYRTPGGEKKVKISSLNGSDRVRSSITFKILNIDNKYRIFLVPNYDYKNICNQDFRFTLNNRSFSLPTPSIDEFDIIDFLNYVSENKEKSLKLLGA